MDSNLVRLVLIALGVVLVVGIYLWDRYKRAAPRVRRVKRVPEAMSIDPNGLQDESPQLTEPAMDDAVESIPEMRIDDEAEAAGRAKPVRRAKPVLDPDPTDLGEWSGAQTELEPQFSMDLRFDAHGESNYLHADPALADDVERKIIVINVKALDGALAGAAIEGACREVGLVHGEMSIYHRHDGGSDRVLFSMASMVEPGIFPIDDMAAFTTPGLSLFTQLPGVRDGIEIYNDMLAVGGRLATLLHAELQDERHNKLTRQMQEHTRESIIEHRHKVRLARSRH